MRARRLLVLTLAAAMLAACGQKGPLYRPDQKPPSENGGASADADG
ncbi:MAG TPA: lipoprotein [Gammaproteobacteria bacterium]|nr:lipoprotein [Gammaproteobacteria bacterium]